MKPRPGDSHPAAGFHGIKALLSARTILLPPRPRRWSLARLQLLLLLFVSLLQLVSLLLVLLLQLLRPGIVSLLFPQVLMFPILLLLEFLPFLVLLRSQFLLLFLVFLIQLRIPRIGCGGTLRRR